MDTHFIENALMMKNAIEGAGSPLPNAIGYGHSGVPEGNPVVLTDEDREQ